jgi:CxxC motif-containing protein (DUF1111 family)
MDEVSPKALAGGETTVFDATRNAFTLAARNLNSSRRAAFFTGNSFFNENWVAAPASTASRDGLGPLFIARSCSACHFKDGRDHAPAEGEISRTLVFRLSQLGRNTVTGAPIPDVRYGGQLQTRALPGVKAEADVQVFWENETNRFADGESYQLRRPRYVFKNEAYGAVTANTLLSVRVAPAMIGLGLLESVSAETLERLADPEDRDGDGISGRINRVWDFEKKAQVIGRFGWKAEQPSVRQQTAGAFNDDMGLTTWLFPQENLTPIQTDAAKMPSGGSPEVSDEILAAVVLYAQTLAVPARRELESPLALRGEILFQSIGCAACHLPELKTGGKAVFPELAYQTIRPYTDLLLHDMGEGLADGREVYEASGSEWRTAPLWGIGLVRTVNGHTEFLHDGRARNLTEAILWHGGEAGNAREKFRALSREERDALLRFLESL